MSLSRNPLGYLEAASKPSQQELEHFYNDKYFASDKNQYSPSYTPDEIRHKNLQCLEIETQASPTARSILDIGCGEGWVLNYFKQKQWVVEGVDFTLDGINHFFPGLRENVRVGNLFHTLDQLISEERRYDVVTCNNVLEHVLDPKALLRGIKALVKPGGICRIVVPNDDSYIQREVVDRGCADPDFWVAIPEHLSYFNVDSLRSILEDSGFAIQELLADFPIDLFLFNPDSNYKRDPKLGKNCHYSRVVIENCIARDSIQSLVAFRRGCAQAKLGRDIIAYCKIQPGHTP